MTKRMFTLSILAGIAAVVGVLASPACAAEADQIDGQQFAERELVTSFRKAMNSSRSARPT